MITDKVKLGRSLDGRYKLTPEKEEELVADIKDNSLSTRELADKYGISIGKVYFMKNPDKKIKRDATTKKFNKVNYNKDKHNEAQKKSRKKKQQLMRAGKMAEQKEKYYKDKYGG